MLETIEEKIERFVQYNEKLMEQIMSIYSHENNGIHAKILFCSLFDSLAKCAYPEIKNNSERFKKTITTHTQWEDAERVSLLHFQRAFKIMDKTPEDFLDLKDEINILFHNYFKPTDAGVSNRISISIDPPYFEIENKWPKNNNGNKIDLGIVTLDKLQHKNLLWLYRNSIVHEYRIPGGGTEPISLRLTNPYYQEIFTFLGDDFKTLKIGHKNFELHYPINFFKQICEESLHSIAKEYRGKRESPFNIYSEGEYWIPEFND